MTDAGLTRRQMIGTGVATMGAVALLPATASAGASKVTTYMLDPRASTKCKSCITCSACQSHAANKLFRSKTAADAGRAHTYCRCGIVEGEPLSAAVFKQIFDGTDAADRRWKRVGSLLVAEVEQHSVPLVSGALPVAALVIGAAGILVVNARRQRAHVLAP